MPEISALVMSFPPPVFPTTASYGRDTAGTSRIPSFATLSISAGSSRFPPSTRKPRVLGTLASLTPPGRLKLAGPLAARAPGFRLGLGLAFALEIERHGSADKVLQGRLIDLVAFVDVDGPPDI